MKRKIKPVKAWAAFADGKLISSAEADFYNGVSRLWIFRTRKDARKTTKDARAVLITPIEQRGRKK